MSEKIKLTDEEIEQLTNNALDKYNLLTKILKNEHLFMVFQDNSLVSEHAAIGAIMSNEDEEISKMLFRGMKMDARIKTLIMAAFSYYLVEHPNKSFAKEMLEFISSKIDQKHLEDE